MALWLLASLFWYSMTAGLSRASCSRMPLDSVIRPQASVMPPISRVVLARSKSAPASFAIASGRVSRSAWSWSRSLRKNSIGSFKVPSQRIQFVTVFEFGIVLDRVAELLDCVDGQRLALLGPQPLVGELSVLSGQHRRKARQAGQAEYQHGRRRWLRGSDAAASTAAPAAQTGSRQAVTGSPASQRRMSAASSSAVAYRSSGFDAIAFRQTASKAAGPPALICGAWETHTASPCRGSSARLRGPCTVAWPVRIA